MKVMKNISAFSAFIVALSVAFSAQAATEQFGPKVVVSATKDSKGNATIKWTAPMKVKAVEHYIGHGKKGGFINTVNVKSDVQEVRLSDLAKNGGRFNFIVASGKYLHEECGGNTETVMPTFRNIKVDCTCVKNNPDDHGTCNMSIPEGQPIPEGMHRVGALVVN